LFHPRPLKTESLTLKEGHSRKPDNLAASVMDYCTGGLKLGLWDILLGEASCQLEAKHTIMTEGHINIIDATPVEAAQSGRGKDANDEPTRDP
jgi:hypothetical protein